MTQQEEISGIGSKRLLEDVDTLLAQLEDTAHGEEGKRITEMRGRVQAAVKASETYKVINQKQ